MRTVLLTAILLGCGPSAPSTSNPPGTGDCTGADADLDGVTDCSDCDDADPTAHPGAPDLCDGVDNDCDGAVDRDFDGVGVCSADYDSTPRADFLFVIDNSCSMLDQTAGLNQTSDPFISALSPDVDYHVGVVSTDMFDSNHSGKLRQAGGVRWIDRDTPNSALVFASMVGLGTGGDSAPKHRDAVYAALEVHGVEGGYNEGFLRSDGSLDVVVISDSLDQSFSIGLDEFSDYLLALRPDSTQVRVHAIVSEDPPCATAWTSEPSWLALQAQTGGLFQSVCDLDWTTTLQGIAAAGDALQEFTLPEPADRDSLAAVVASTPYPPHTEYSALDLELLADGVTVRLPEPAPRQGTVTIFYAPL